MNDSTENYTHTHAPPKTGIAGVLTRIRFERVLLALLLIAASTYDFKQLTRFPIAVGVDGYYYVQQVNSILQHGSPYFHTNTPVVPYTLAAITYFNGNPVMTIKIVTIVLQLLLCLSIFALIMRLTRSAWLGLLGAAMAAISALRFYMLSEFINNLAAVVLLLWAAWFLITFIQSERLAWGLCFAVVFVAALFSHHMSIVVVVATIVFVRLLHLLNTQRSLSKRITAALVLVLLWFMPLLVAAQHLFEPPFGMRGEASIVPRLPLDRYAFAEELMVIIGGTMVLLLLFRFKNEGESRLAFYVFCSVALWSLIVTLNPFLSPQRGWLSLAERLRGLAYIQAAILVPGLLWYSARKVSPRFPLYLMAAILPLILLSVFSPQPSGMSSDFLSDRQQLVEAIPAARSKLGDAPFVIAAHGDQFLITAITGVTAQQTPPQDSGNKPVYWLIKRWPNQHFTPSDVLVRPDSPETSIIFAADRDLMTRIARFDASGRRQLFALNPHLASYYFELRKTNDDLSNQ